MIQFAHDALNDLEACTSREWLETNGLGGFASSSIIGLNTRRYHGLLTAATKPPVGRIVMLSKLEETLVIDGRRYEISSNQYPGAVHPQGFKLQTGFRLDPFPIFTYEFEGIEIEKSVFMVQGENTTVIQYQLTLSNKFQFVEPSADEHVAKTADSPLLTAHLSLELRPLVAFRDYHSTTHENSALNSHVAIMDGLASVAPYAGLPPLHFAHDAEKIETNSFWYRNFEYRVEQERGLDFHEDLFSLFILRFAIDGIELAKKSGFRVSVIASTERRDAKQADQLRQDEAKRRQKMRTEMSALPKDDDLVRALTVAADQYIVTRGEQKTIIAGYHWFADWGRDTMIALPGLTLATGRFEIARSILLEFAKYVDQGMLPNRFPDAGETPEYNTVDATLWFFEAVRALADNTDDYEFVGNNLYGVLADIISWHVRGTRYNIQVDADGLLGSGEPGGH